jgi:hypothetical protein
MVKIMVIDSQGPALGNEYRALLHQVEMRGIEPPELRGKPCHPHGAFCGYLAALPLIGAGVKAEIIFLRVFDQDARWAATNEFILGAISREEPDYISRSWGAWDGDSMLGRLNAETAFEDFLKPYEQLQKRIGFLDFGAAGNNDENDEDNDVDCPQRLMAGCYIIGACHRNGIPTKWSGDGAGVMCVMWADRVYSPAQAGRWTLWSGTSAATPKACGAAAAMNFERLSFFDAVQNLPESCRPIGNHKLPHPKFGWGCAEDLWQRYVARLPASVLPPAHKVRVADLQPIAYHDYRRFEGYGDRERARNAPHDRGPAALPQEKPGKSKPDAGGRADAARPDLSTRTAETGADDAANRRESKPGKRNRVKRRISPDLPQRPCLCVKGKIARLQRLQRVLQRNGE